MHITFCNRWLLILLFISTCLVATYAKGGRGGGGRGGGGSRGGGFRSSRPSYSRPAPAPAYRPPPAPVYRPPPAPVYRLPPAPVYRPPPAPVYRPPPPPVYKPPPPLPANRETFGPSVVVRQPASNPNFKEADLKQGSANKQPAYNPNYKPDASAPAGPPPAYSPAGHPVPSAPVGPPPAYRPNQPSAPLGNPPPGVQPPPYPGPPVRPPAYPGQSAPYPVQPGGPPTFNQPGVNRPYPVQPGGPPTFNQPGVNRPYPVQPGYPGGFHQQPGISRPYPVQPGVNYPHTGGSRPYPQQPLGGNVWQPHHNVPAPAYMNYGGLPTGANMYTKPHKQKGFLGSLMSAGKHKTPKQNKYLGSYPSPYGVGSMGHGGGFLGKHGKSAAMYTIFPYMAAKAIKKPKLFKPRFGYMPIFIPRPYYHYHYHHHHGSGEIDGKFAAFYDVYNDSYVGKCQRPIKIEHGEIKCKPTSKETRCDARCETGYRFPNNIELVSNECWHITGIWRPKKNFPQCKPICENECMNGGECARPGVCKCPAEFRGSRCQLHFLNCDIRTLLKGQEKVGWVCNHLRNETICKINCKEPWKFESPPDEYKCSPEGVWKPDTVPHCVDKENRDLEGIFPDI